MRKSVWLGLVLAFLFAWAAAASAVQIGIHGRLDHKVQYANTLGITQANLQKKAVALNKDDGDINAFWAAMQYRLWFDIASDDGNVKGVWAFEAGSAPFGTKGVLDIDSAGDTNAFETRLAYADVKLPVPGLDDRVAIGLQEVNISPWLFKEIATGIVNHGTVDAGTAKVAYQLGWVRADNSFDVNNHWLEYTDVLFGALAFDVQMVKVKTFAAYETNNNPWWIGAELSATPIPGLDLGLTGIYEGGSDEKKDRDYSAYFVAFVAGYQLNDQVKGTFVFWYASGDDDSTDKDIDNYSAIKTDTYGSVIFFEDAAFDDGYYASSKPYVDGTDLGFYVVRVRGDYKATPQLSLAAAVNYLSFAEDYEVTISGKKESENSIGWEIDGYVTYELYKGLNLNLVAGYLVSGDALDLINKALNGRDADNLYRVSAGVTFTW